MLESKIFKERFQMLVNVLQLPPRNSLVKNLSGGEQRRVSFAVAVIHDPKLLLLDEPTVGLDILLRNRIWNFLLQQANQKHLTVLMSTHYLNELSKAHRGVMMRNGVLLTNDKPKNMLEQYNLTSFDKIFYNLSLEQENGEFIAIENKTCTKEITETLEKSENVRLKVIYSLLKAEFNRIHRLPG